MSFNFEFNLSIRRAVTAVAREPHVIDRAASSSSARLSALESRSLYYQSILNESRGLVAAGYAESRTIQTELFYSRTRELSLSLPVSRAEQFEQTRARVTRSFQLSISMDFSFLAQFTRQSETISSLDDDLFGRYLDNTDGLSNHSSKVLQSFFDDVDRILEKSEVFVALSLSSFFGQVADHFGLNAEAAAMLEGMVMDEVKAFFDDVENFLSEARAAFSGPADPTIPLEAATPNVVSTPSEDTIEEEDPAVLLV